MGWVLAFFLEMFRCLPGVVHIALIPKSAEITQTFSKQGEAVQTCECIKLLLCFFLLCVPAFWGPKSKDTSDFTWNGAVTPCCSLTGFPLSKFEFWCPWSALQAVVTMPVRLGYPWSALSPVFATAACASFAQTLHFSWHWCQLNQNRSIQLSILARSLAPWHSSAIAHSEESEAGQGWSVLMPDCSSVCSHQFALLVQQPNQKWHFGASFISKTHHEH